MAPTLERITLARDTVLKLVKERIVKVNEEVEKDDTDKDDLELTFTLLETTIKEYQELSYKVLEKCDPANYEKERKDVDAVSQNWIAVVQKMEKMRQNTSPSPPGSLYGTEDDRSVSSGSSGKKRSFKLPKIELKKFSGGLMEWLGWWSQFRKIDEDEDLHTSDKFQYLLQCMVVGSRARDVVEGYPMTDENYPKTIKALQQRFGKHRLLKQIYVRELLKLVISNTKSKEKVQLSKLYDKLESHLRALETLNVTTEQTAEFVFPMVESSLPEDIFVAWQRSPLYGQDGSQLDPPRTELFFLMKFLRKEVESENQRKLVRAGFESDSAKDKRKDKSSHNNNRKEECATAASMFSASSQGCVFCDRSGHASADCFKAQVMTLKDKNEKIRAKKCCYLCFRSGHLSRNCKVAVKCIVCSKKHAAVMCPELDKKKMEFVPRERESPENSAAMTNFQCSGNVLLQTLKIRCYTDDGSKNRVVRLVFDNGSQGSCVRRDTTETLGLRALEEVWSQKVLFGGALAAKQKHRKFRLRLSNMSKTMYHELVVLDEPEICEDSSPGKFCNWSAE